uniref:LRRCT domain-containing protein n=1 Tax=Anopheles minimus TaxID=112268 RepID=A0A182W578_9DIPT
MKTLSRILVLLVIVGTVTPESYEDGTSICDRCTCLIANKTSTVLSYDLLDCTRKNLQHMIGSWPERFITTDPEREIVLSLSGNNIVSLQQLPATKTTLVFSCSHCNLESLASGLFIDTVNILRADLSFNKLSGESLSGDVFRGQYNAEDGSVSLLLDELDLASNVITKLQVNAFEHIAASLRHLSLARNPLGQVTSSTRSALAQLTNLEHLDLSHCSLTDIDASAFDEMHALRELYIQGNHFTAIPQTVYQLDSLHLLHLAENPFEVLTFAQPLKQLVQLNVSSMSLMHTVEVESFQNVKQLKTLTVRNNMALEVFDLSVLRHVSFLKELDLSQSNIKHLHTPLENGAAEQQDEMAYKNTLEVLLLSGNPWHCDCALQRVLKYVQFSNLPDYDEDDETRCETPYVLTSLHLTDLTHIEVCDQPIHDGPNSPVYEKPAFLRPRAIFLSLLSVGIVVGLGIIIGLVIVCLKRRLKTQVMGFTSPVRYTSVRESKTSAVYQI